MAVTNPAFSYLNSDEVYVSDGVFCNPAKEEVKQLGIAKKEKEEKNEKLEREKKMQKAMLDIKKKYGKNAILKGMNLQEDGTAMERNRQIGGHKA